MEQEPGSTTRREFARSALQSLTSLVLIEGLWSQRLLGADVRPIVDAWFKELNSISQDVHNHQLKDVEFQQSLEGLYRRVDMKAVLQTLDFDKLAAGVSFPAKGAKSLPVDFSHVGGLPVKLPFGGQIFAMRKGRWSSPTATTIWPPDSWSSEETFEAGITIALRIMPTITSSGRRSTASFDQANSRPFPTTKTTYTGLRMF